MVLQPPPPPSTASPAAAQLFLPCCPFPTCGAGRGNHPLCPHQYLLFQAQILHIDWKEIKKIASCFLCPNEVNDEFSFGDYFALSIQQDTRKAALSPGGPRGVCSSAQAGLL